MPTLACSSGDAANPAETAAADVTGNAAAGASSMTSGGGAMASGGETSGGDVGGAGGSGTGTAAASNNGICARDARLGTFQIYLKDDRTIFSGAVSTAVAPGAIPLVAASEGECQLMTPRNLFCSEGCESGQTCAGDDTCVPTPEKVSAGTVRVTGLQASLEVNPNGISLDYSKTITDPFPGFEPGASISLSADGATAEAFSMSAFGVPLLTSSMDTASVARGSSTVLSWDASGVDPANTEMFIDFTVNAHGSVTGWIECTVEDDGSFEIPESLVTQLIDLGLSGFPRVTLNRRSAANASVAAGCVDLRIESDVTLELDVEGLTSCSNDDDCPDGMSCAPELACQ